jgi:fumarylacetoacetase
VPADVQAWEYQPLGPFLSKTFATTISPWIVTIEALAPYRAAWQRDAVDPQPLPHLDCADLRASGGLDIELKVLLETETMRLKSQEPTRLLQSNFRFSYWTVAQLMAQLMAQHTVNGCTLNPGDVLGSDTQSGPESAEASSLLELTVGGKRPITLPNSEKRVFIEDGDCIVLRGWAAAPGRPRIGFGEASSTVLRAR